MHFRTKTAFFAVGILAIGGLTIWPGCATPPLPASRKSISMLAKSDLPAVQRARLTRQELVSKVGEPTAYFPDLRVSCYRLNQVSRRRLVLFLGVLPVGAFKDNVNLEFAMIEFDEQDRVLRFTTEIGYDGRQGMELSAKRWSTKRRGDLRVQ